MPDHEQESVPDYIQEKLRQDFKTPDELIVRKDQSLIKGPKAVVKKRSPINRVTVVEHLHHQVEGDDTTTVTAKYSRILATDTSAYVRKNAKIGEDWKPLEVGFIAAADVGVFVIMNVTGNNLQVIPSQEEQAEIDATIIQIGKRILIPDKEVDMIEDIIDIPPNRHAHVDPSASADRYFMRCLKGTAKFNIFVIPK